MIRQRGWRCGLIGIYALTALLGHAGLHAVQDATGHATSHEHAQSVVPQALRVFAAAICEELGFFGCHDHGGQVCDRSSESPASHEPHRHGDPVHDPNSCLICHFSASPGVVAAPIPAPAIETIGETVAAPVDRLIAAHAQFALPIRGPPSPHC